MNNHKHLVQVMQQSWHEMIIEKGMDIDMDVDTGLLAEEIKEHCPALPYPVLIRPTHTNSLLPLK